MPKRRPVLSVAELEAKRREIRRSLADAANDSSWTSVATLHRLDMDILVLIHERQAIEAAEAEARRQASLVATPTSQLVTEVLELARALPAAVRAELARELAGDAPRLRVVGE